MFILDRDGVINYDYGHVHKIEDIDSSDILVFVQLMLLIFL